MKYTNLSIPKGVVAECTAPSLLIRPVFKNSRDARERRGFHTHVNNGEGKPICDFRQQTFGATDRGAAMWIAAEGTQPTCSICQRRLARSKAATKRAAAVQNKPSLG